MRVAIVTQELMHNYGGTLQAYAMQEVLRRLWHDLVTVDYVYNTILKLHFAACRNAWQEKFFEMRK